MNDNNENNNNINENKKFFIYTLCFILFLLFINCIYVNADTLNDDNIDGVIKYIKIVSNVEDSTTTIIPHKQIISENNKLEEVTAIYSTNIEINKVLELSFTKLGYPYSQALRELKGYYDCSSFVRRLYEEITGVNIGSNTYDISNNLWAYQIDFSDLQPGDLLWQEGHIAMYIDNGKIIHASGTPKCVAIESMYEPRLKFTKAFRAINYINNVRAK